MEAVRKVSLKMSGSNNANKNKRYRCYRMIAYTCGYTQRRKFFVETIKYVREKFPMPDGKYSRDSRNKVHRQW